MAKLYYDSLIYLDPDDAIAYLNRGNTKEYGNDAIGALQDYKLAIHLNPELSEAYFSLGKVQFSMENYAMAIKTFQKLLDLPPSDTQALYFRGITRGSQESKASFDGLVSTHTIDADIYNYLGLSFKSLNSFKEAREMFDKAINLRSEPEYFVNRGLVHYENREYDLAIADYKRALAIEGDHSLALHNLMLASKQAGYGNAPTIKEYTRIIDSDPTLFWPYLSRGFLYMESELYFEALNDYDKVIRLGDKRADNYINRGRAKESLKRYDDAIFDFEFAIKLSASANGYSHLANCHFRQRNYAKAIEYYNSAISLDPSNEGYYFNRALANYNSKNYQIACNDLKRSIELGMKPESSIISRVCKQ